MMRRPAAAAVLRLAFALLRHRMRGRARLCHARASFFADSAARVCYWQSCSRISNAAATFDICRTGAVSGSRVGLQAAATRQRNLCSAAAAAAAEMLLLLQTQCSRRPSQRFSRSCSTTQRPRRNSLLEQPCSRQLLPLRGPLLLPLHMQPQPPHAAPPHSHSIHHRSRRQTPPSPRCRCSRRRRPVFGCRCRHRRLCRAARCTFSRRRLVHLPLPLSPPQTSPRLCLRARVTLPLQVLQLQNLQCIRPSNPLRCRRRRRPHPPNAQHVTRLPLPQRHALLLRHQIFAHVHMGHCRCHS